MKKTPTTIEPPKPTQLDMPWTTQDWAIFEQAATAALKRTTRADPRPRQPTAPSAKVLVYPTVFVCVPRAAVSHYQDQPWADVFAAAKRGVDGLAVITTRPQHWGGRAGERPPLVLDVAYLAEGQHDWRGRTVLYQQNW